MADIPAPKVLIVDGGNYCATQIKVEGDLGPGEFVDHSKVVKEIERLFEMKFTTKFFFQGTNSGKPNDFHKYLAQPPPHGPHYNIEILGKKFQSGNTNQNNNSQRASIFIEEGVDVAVGTKIIECAYGIGKESISDKIVVITGDGDLLKAIECADAKKRNTVFILTAKHSLSASLNRYVHIDKHTECAVFLDDVMKQCVSVRNNEDMTELHDQIKQHGNFRNNRTAPNKAQTQLISIAPPQSSPSQQVSYAAVVANINVGSNNTQQQEKDSLTTNTNNSSQATTNNTTDINTDTTPNSLVSETVTDNPPVVESKNARRNRNRKQNKKFAKLNEALQHAANNDSEQDNDTNPDIQNTDSALSEMQT